MRSLTPMKTDTKLIPSALLASALLFGAVAPGLAQQVASPPATEKNEKEEKEDQVINLEAVVTTGTRTAKAIDQIPGAIKLITNAEITNTLLLTDDATAVLARTVPGYSPATQQLQNTGETLRGRVALRLFDGISQTTPLREGSRNATFTDMDVVAQIEVINGPSASEGIGAAGGIINYISKSPTTDGSEAIVRAKYWTQGKDDSDGYRVGLNYTFKDGPTDLIFAASVSVPAVPPATPRHRISSSRPGATSVKTIPSGSWQPSASSALRARAAMLRTSAIVRSASPIPPSPAFLLVPGRHSTISSNTPWPTVTRPCSAAP